jgi:nitric oxide reductase NorD protein
MRHPAEMPAWPLLRRRAALMHAAGARQRVAAAAPGGAGGTRSCWQRVAGSGTHAPAAGADRRRCAGIARHACRCSTSAALNRDLYLWWAALAGADRPGPPGWVDANAVAAAAALERFPGLHSRWQRLVQAQLGLRSRTRRSHGSPPSGRCALR